MTSETEKSRTGRLGEEAVTTLLRRNGHRIVARNWRHGHYELDIVSERCGTLHLVEVKTRQVDSLTPPEMALTDQKQRSLRRAASLFLAGAGRRYEGFDLQFDLASVRITPEETIAAIDLIENAIEFGW
jgi:putative endonuclease